MDALGSSLVEMIDKDANGVASKPTNILDLLVKYVRGGLSTVEKVNQFIEASKKQDDDTRRNNFIVCRGVVSGGQVLVVPPGSVIVERVLGKATMCGIKVAYLDNVIGSVHNMSDLLSYQSQLAALADAHPAAVLLSKFWEVLVGPLGFDRVHAVPPNPSV